MTDQLSSGYAASRLAGDSTEADVIQSTEGLEYVPDTDIEFADGRVVSAAVTINEISIPRDTLIEIKSAMVVYGASQQRGRFYLREGQHERLVEADGVYLFVVVTPDPTREILAMRIVPAEDVSKIVTSWYDGGDRADYTQPYWDAVFDSTEITRGGRA